MAKSKNSTRIVKDGKQTKISFSDLSSRFAPTIDNLGSSNKYFNDHNCSHYGEYEGTYAHDVAGYSDDIINDAFDGEPEAYWNID